uniref:Zinc finger protein 286A n=1 Tax=Rhinolophus ferrumequinum TaxID=59479 RepID=A0A671EZS3_RHIFE
MERDLAKTPAKRAMSSQDSSFSQEKSTEEGEVAALRLTASSQGFQFPSLRTTIWRMKGNR